MFKDLLKLARPTQWTKSGFVVIGPLYALAAGTKAIDWLGVTVTAFAFCLVASACYVTNDLKDRELDAAHPRKRHRPIAAGRISPAQARGYAIILLLIGLAPMCAWIVHSVTTGQASHWEWPLALLGVYWLNVTSYSYVLKHRVVIDVISLSVGFVVRVLAGCAAANVEPSPWLVNSTFFISMFLAFSKRLGERRTMGSAEGAASARTVQVKYTDDILRMLVVVTAVATLLTYAGYVQSFGLRHGERPGPSFTLLWLTMIPATYCLLRCIVLVERGDYDDPTELASHDRPFQVAAVVFGLITIAAWMFPRTVETIAGIH
ncbi:MAG TPA: UbiA prenyltransferase family protein [Phycisphaerales bacterium]|nr:UbiA prenyltransferase family protein [Phycisphaerales bacterium]